MSTPILFDPTLKSRLSTNLEVHPRATIANANLRHAAVAIAVTPGHNGEAAFVLTRRHAGLRAHANQYALPGGRLDTGEDAVTAALREMHEEVGVESGEADVLGCLDDYQTRSGYIMTPVVVWVPDPNDLVAQPGEVDDIHLIDLTELQRPDSPRWIKIEESKKLVLQLPLRNRLIHAPTGALLWQFREVGLNGTTIRLDEVEEPTFAWR